MKYSGFKVIKEALTGHRGWGPAWRSPEPSSEYDYIIIGVRRVIIISVGSTL